MIGQDTIFRAKTIVKRGDVVYNAKESSPPNILHFKVKQRDGEWADVYLKKLNEIDQWSCNAVSEKRGKTWGCPMNVCDRSKPFCSHTHSVKLFIDKQNKEVEDASVQS